MVCYKCQQQVFDKKKSKITSMLCDHCENALPVVSLRQSKHGQSWKLDRTPATNVQEFMQRGAKHYFQTFRGFGRCSMHHLYHVKALACDPYTIYNTSWPWCAIRTLFTAFHGPDARSVHYLQHFGRPKTSGIRGLAGIRGPRSLLRRELDMSCNLSKPILSSLIKVKQHEIFFNTRMG